MLFHDLPTKKCMKNWWCSLIPWLNYHRVTGLIRCQWAAYWEFPAEVNWSAAGFWNHSLGLKEHWRQSISKHGFHHLNLVRGIPTPLKNMKVSWDDEIPNIWKNKSHVPNHQPGIARCWTLKQMMSSWQSRIYSDHELCQPRLTDKLRWLVNVHLELLRWHSYTFCE